jgi:ADP-heptose:LPS heptosyltransferase
VTTFRQSLLGVFPVPLRSFLKSLRKKIRDQIDFLYFPLWLVFQCARHRKKAVILYRLAALGDVVCTLPMCGEIRKRHPGRLLVYVTSANYEKMVHLSRSTDGVFGASWLYGTPWNYPGHFFGLVEKVYIPQTTTDERFPNVGAQSHLVDDLATSCDLTIPSSDRQPRLFPSPELIRTVCAEYGLTDDVAAGRLLIGINCGHTWPVREWSAAKWQQLVALFHTEFDATILQFGLTHGSEDEYEHLCNVRFLANRLKSDELVALVAGCRLLVSIDSGPVHIAGAVGTPVIGLFGAVNPSLRLPPDSPAVGLFSNVPCRFCQHRTPIEHWKNGCPYDIRCMKELEVHAVFEAIKSMIAKQAIMPSPTIFVSH